MTIFSIFQARPAQSIIREDVFPASDTQCPMLKYNFNMSYILATVAYFHFHSEENNKE